MRVLSLSSAKSARAVASRLESIDSDRVQDHICADGIQNSYRCKGIQNSRRCGGFRAADAEKFRIVADAERSRTVAEVEESSKSSLIKGGFAALITVYDFFYRIRPDMAMRFESRTSHVRSTGSRSKSKTLCVRVLVHDDTTCTVNLCNY